MSKECGKMTVLLHANSSECGKRNQLALIESKLFVNTADVTTGEMKVNSNKISNEDIWL